MSILLLNWVSVTRFWLCRIFNVPHKLGFLFLSCMFMLTLNVITGIKLHCVDYCYFYNQSACWGISEFFDKQKNEKEYIIVIDIVISYLVCILSIQDLSSGYASILSWFLPVIASLVEKLEWLWRKRNKKHIVTEISQPASEIITINMTVRACYICSNYLHSIFSSSIWSINVSVPTYFFFLHHCRIQQISGRFAATRNWRRYLTAKTRLECSKLENCSLLISSNLRNVVNALNVSDVSCKSLGKKNPILWN